MLTFKEEKMYAVKMWKEIRSILRKRTCMGNMFYTNSVAFIKRNIIYSINAAIDKDTKPGAKYNCIVWKYDCILCHYANQKGNGCEACPLVRMGFLPCSDHNSPYDIIGNAFMNNYREEVEIRKAECACNTIIKAIRKLTKRINYDKI